MTFMIAVLFMPFFAPNIKVLLAAQILQGSESTFLPPARSVGPSLIPLPFFQSHGVSSRP